MLTPGGTLGGRYRLTDRIATGGMGDVWKAEDTVLGRIVAVKILQSALLEEPGFIERFRGEARVMATLNHPGVVRVYDYGETEIPGGGKVAYLVMEYIDGEALSRTLSRVGRINAVSTMNLLAQAADALHAAHEHGIVHRDVKPGNLLVRPDGKLVLTDFGIARSASSGQLTTAGSILGTASYVSPEQASGTTVTAASDVYSLGVVGWQCLVGHRPFEGDNPVAVAMSHIRDEAPPLPPDVPPGARAVIERAMAKDPVQRWPSASAMADAARQAASGGMPAAAPTSGAGTTVLPVSPGVGGPTSGAPTGSFARGAAGIPTGPRRPVEEDYGYADHQPPRRNGLLIAGIILAVLVVLAGAGGIAYALWGGKGNNPSANNTPQATNTSQSVAPSPNCTTGLTLDSDSYQHQSYTDVSNDLKSKGLRVTRQYESATGFKAGEVTRVSTANGSNQVHCLDVVTVYVETDNGGIHFPTGIPGLPGNGDGGNNNGNGGNGGQPSSTPSPASPSGSPKGTGNAHAPAPPAGTKGG